MRAGGGGGSDNRTDNHLREDEVRRIWKDQLVRASMFVEEILCGRQQCFRKDLLLSWWFCGIIVYLSAQAIVLVHGPDSVCFDISAVTNFVRCTLCFL